MNDERLVALQRRARCNNIYSAIDFVMSCKDLGIIKMRGCCTGNIELFSIIECRLPTLRAPL
jgi:hypothetical protein